MALVKEIGRMFLPDDACSFNKVVRVRERVCVCVALKP